MKTITLNQNKALPQSTKTLRIVYWTLIALFSLFMTMDAIGGLTLQEDGIKALTTLQYPIYILPVMGAFKLLGITAILQTRSRTLTEWAYAGFTFNFILASISWAAVKGPVLFILLPLIVLAVMLSAYFLSKKK